MTRLTDGDWEILREMEADAFAFERSVPVECRECNDTGWAYEMAWPDDVVTVPCPFGCEPQGG